MSVDPRDTRNRNMAFVRLYPENFRRFPDGKAGQLFWLMCSYMDATNVAQLTMFTLVKETEFPRRSVYRYLDSLQDRGLVAKLEKNVWMLDPTIVYRGDYRYHRATRMEFGKLLGTPIAAEASRKETSGMVPPDARHDEADLQPADRDPDHSPADAPA